MELVKSLLNSFSHVTEHHGFSFEANQTLFEEMLSNFAIEKADMEQVVASLKELKSERIKMSVLRRLGDLSTSDRFTIQCLERNDEEFQTEEDFIAHFMRSLDYKYWHTLFNRLNIRNVLPINDGPDLKGYLTLYISEDPIAFNLEGIKKFLSIFENLYDAEKEKEKLEKLIENYEVVLEPQKNGTTKLKILSRDRYKVFGFDIADRIAAALYLTGAEWYLNKNGEPKTKQTDIKGVEWMSFKNSNHILTMDKDTSDAFRKAYGLDF